MTNTANVQSPCCYTAALGFGFLDIVNHDDTCPALAALDATIAGDLIPAGDVAPWREWVYRDDREVQGEES